MNLHALYVNLKNLGLRRADRERNRICRAEPHSAGSAHAFLKRAQPELFAPILIKLSTLITPRIAA